MGGLISMVSMVKFKKAVILVLIFAFILPGILPGRIYASQSAATRFSDVPEGHWAYKAIHDLRLLGITDGIGNNRFGIGLTITRGEFVTLLVRLMKWELISPERGSFADNMDVTKWYYKPIETALRHGVVLNDTGRFRVNEPITREEMAIMIVRSLGYNSLAKGLAYLGSPFGDVRQNMGYITIAKDFGIINGVGNNLFKPYDTAKREEAAAMMMRMYEKLNMPINELHAFYAIQSAGQMEMIKSLDSVGFGWSRLEYNAESNRVVLNTTGRNNNVYAIPDGFLTPLTLARDNNVSTQLMVTVKDETVFDTETKSNVALTEYIITRPEIRRQVIDSIMLQINASLADDIAVTFDGVVIDFENLKGDPAKHSFNAFLKELAQELDKSNKLLYVAVHPARRPGLAYYDGYDYKTIGEVADRVILMAHDYYAKQLEDADMQSGYTFTPLTPIDEVYYALRSITDEHTGVQDLSKVWLQFSFDSAQWKLKEGKVIRKDPYNPSYKDIANRLLMDGVTINYSDADLVRNPYATFFDSRDETHNVIWYEDSRSIQAKINLAKMFGVRGISLWRLGNIPDFMDTDSKNIYLDVWQQVLSNMADSKSR